MFCKKREKSVEEINFKMFYKTIDNEMGNASRELRQYLLGKIEYNAFTPFSETIINNLNGRLKSIAKRLQENGISNDSYKKALSKNGVDYSEKGTYVKPKVSNLHDFNELRKAILSVLKERKIKIKEEVDESSVDEYQSSAPRP